MRPAVPRPARGPPCSRGGSPSPRPAHGARPRQSPRRAILARAAPKRRSTASRTSGAAPGCRVAALERLAEADAFPSSASTAARRCGGCGGSARRRCRLFAAADAREAGFSPEGCEPPPSRPLTAGREVVEDYRTLQLSLRAHPLELPARPARRQGDRALRRPRRDPRRPPGRGRRDGPRPPAPGLGQRRRSSPSRTRPASPTASSGATGSRSTAAR